MDLTITGTESVPIDSLNPHPDNPRRGDVEAIAESLRTLGQFKPITVNRRGRTVLAGHHTILAARSLGWTDIAVAWVDVDDDEARRIMLGDNRISDLASYDDTALLAILRELPDLDGTGFTTEEVDRLDGLYEQEGRGPGGEDASDSVDRVEDPNAPARVRLGPVFFIVNPHAYEDWYQGLLDEIGEEKKVGKAIRARLAIPDARRRSTKQADVVPSPTNLALDVHQVPIDSIRPLPGNARQGDIGAISESLTAFGQYRPLVVHAQERTILVGNHTYQAALALGWSHVSVVWADVDEATAYKIAVADNRTSDLGEYDDEALTALLLQVTSLQGTGFDGEDVQDILNGGGTKPGPRKRVSCLVGETKFSVDRLVFNAWLNDVEEPQVHTVIGRLGFDPSDCHVEEN